MQQSKLKRAEVCGLHDINTKLSNGMHSHGFNWAIPPTRKNNERALTCIGILTGYLFIVPIPDKEVSTVRTAYLSQIYH